MSVWPLVASECSPSRRNDSCMMKSFPVSPSSAGAGAALLLGLSLGLLVQDAPRTLAPARTRAFLCCLKGLGLKLLLSLCNRQTEFLTEKQSA